MTVRSRALPALVALLALSALTATAAGARDPGRGRAEVMVVLSAPPLAGAEQPRARAAARVAAEQRRFLRALQRRIPGATVRWRYRLVANGLAIVLPTRALNALRGLPGVRDVVASVRYGETRAAVGEGPSQIGADALWGQTLEGAGQGVKIGIIDTGVDQSHPYFSPRGYTMPPGFPKGNRRYTTAKVIVARSFAPAGWERTRARLPVDDDGHGTHVAGIAAGNASTPARGARISGVAPRAYIGNYRALTIPTESGVGHDGNAPEIVAAIEAAVADGMDVINLSIGEPEVEPSRDVVALALDAAFEAGVVSVTAAGNDFSEYGRGSISSPATSRDTIAVGAVELPSEGGTDVLDFSSAGPSALSLRLKPEVAAPGSNVLSSVPGGGWEEMSGTSMASPHVAGVVALLRQRHPEWTAADVRAAIVGTARPARATTRGRPALPSRVGAGVVDAPAADRSLVAAEPSTVSLGLLAPGSQATQTVAVRDLGAGPGTWTVAVELMAAPRGARVTAPPAVEVPGEVTLTASTTSSSSEGELTGVVLLRRGTDVRRVPLWGRVERAALARAPRTRLTRPGEYTTATRGTRSLVRVYRYPQLAAGADGTLEGPERVFRIVTTGPLANFGVAITSREAGVQVQPRVVRAGDENRLTGYAALPLNHNPYLAGLGERVLAAGALRPAPGAYDIVFDSPTARGAGRFTFRYWVNDVTPPTAGLVSRSIVRGDDLRLRVSDRGSGVFPASVVASVDGRQRAVTVRNGIVHIRLESPRRGRHRLRLQVSDYQETRNTENVLPILPNTRVLTTTFVVR